MEPVLVIRHCQATSAEPNAPLSAGGRLAARFLAEKLGELGVDAAYASPTAKAEETLAPFAETKDLAMTLDERFADGNLVRWPLREIGLHMRRHFRDPYNYAAGAGGETLYEAQLRGLAALADIASRGHEYPAVAMHGILMAALLRHFDDKFGYSNWEQLKTPEMHRITFEGREPVKIEPVV